MIDNLNEIKKQDGIQPVIDTTSLGQEGITIINDTILRVGNWKVIQARSETTFTILDEIGNDGNNADLTITLAAREIIYGQFIRIQLASGEIRAYK